MFNYPSIEVLRAFSKLRNNEDFEKIITFIKESAIEQAILSTKVLMDKEEHWADGKSQALIMLHEIYVTCNERLDKIQKEQMIKPGAYS